VLELGAVYASAQEQALYHPEVSRIAAELGLRLVTYAPKGPCGSSASSSAPQTRAILLFIGGTPELAQFTLGLEKQDRQRYVIGLFDASQPAESGELHRRPLYPGNSADTGARRHADPGAAGLPETQPSRSGRLSHQLPVTATHQRLRDTEHAQCRWPHRRLNANTRPAGFGCGCYAAATST